MATTIIHVEDGRVTTPHDVSPSKKSDSFPTRMQHGKRDEGGQDHSHERQPRHCRPFEIRKRFLLLAAVILSSVVTFTVQQQQSSQPLRPVLGDLAHRTTAESLLLSPRVLAAAQASTVERLTREGFSSASTTWTPAFLRILTQHGVASLYRPPKIFIYRDTGFDGPYREVYGPTCKDAPWYRVEHVMVQELATRFETTDPHEADWFLIPHHTICFGHNITWRDLPKGAAPNIWKAFATVCEEYLVPLLHHIQHKYPFFNKTNGRNHLMIHAHDSGIRALPAPVIAALRETVRLQIVGFDNTDFWTAEKLSLPDRPLWDIVIPTRNLAISKVIEMDIPTEADGYCAKTSFACFMGTVHKQKEYSKGVRHALQEQAGNDTRLFVTASVPDYAARLCSYTIRLPFSRWIDYRKFTVKLHDATVRDGTGYLNILSAMPKPAKDAKLAELTQHAALLDYELDAPHMVALELWWRHFMRENNPAITPVELWSLPSHAKPVGSDEYY